VQAITGAVSAAIGTLSSYKLLAWRVNKLEVTIDKKLDKEVCIERRSACDPCKKKVDGIVSDVEESVRCINKYVDDCKIGVK
jgi:hypothetical protein